MINTPRRVRSTRLRGTRKLMTLEKRNNNLLPTREMKRGISKPKEKKRLKDPKRGMKRIRRDCKQESLN